MSDHEFEKRVRQELNDLRITPSGATWVRIEEELKQKRRRRPLLWLPVLFLGLVAGGYYVMTQSATNHTSPTIAKTEPAASNSLKPVTDQKSAEPTAPAASSSATNTDTKQHNTTETLHSNQPVSATDPGIAGSDQTVTTSANEIKRKIKPSLPRSASGVSVVARSSNDQQQKLHRAPQTHTRASSVSTRTENDLIAGVVDDMLSDGKKQKQPIVEIQNQPLPAALSEKELTIAEQQLRYRFTVGNALNYPAPDVSGGVVKPIASQSTTFTESVPGVPILIKKASRWSYAITASAGSTMIGEGKLGVNKSMVEDVSRTTYANYNFSQGGVSRPNIPSPGPYRPSGLNPGLGYTFGGIVKRELSDRFSVSGGLNYSRLTTYSTVGERVDQPLQLNNGPYGTITVSSYFRFQEAEPKEYTNRYHFIELPVTLHTALIRSKTLPLYFNAGVSISRLLTSNSLFFDGTSGVYYRDKKLINQTQSALLTGFDVALFNRSKHPLWIGPELRYNLSRILKKDINGNKHLMYLGVDLKWFIKK